MRSVLVLGLFDQAVRETMIARGGVRRRPCLGGQCRRTIAETSALFYRAACPVQVTRCVPVAHISPPQPEGRGRACPLWSRWDIRTRSGEP
jgi:hypothetical protein